MKKNSFYLLLFLTTFFLYACPSAEPNNNNLTETTNSASNIPTERKGTSEDTTLGVDTTYVSDNGQVNISFVWEAVSGATEYKVVVTSDGQDDYIATTTETTVVVPTNLQLNQEFTASLTATMNDRSIYGPILYRSSYCNGGGTVDDVFRSPDWKKICNESSCDFLRFRSRDIEDCTGTLVDPLPWRLRGGTYYKREDVCNCLTSGGTIDVCDGVKDLKLNPCLESLTKCLKHDYQPCGE